MNKFKVGQKYKVLKPMSEAGNVIEIIKIKGKKIYYKTVSGDIPIIDCFEIDSNIAKTLEILSEPENEESEKRVVKACDYIRILDNAKLSRHSLFKTGDVVKVLSVEPDYSSGGKIVRLSDLAGDFLYPTEYEILHDYKPEKEKSETTWFNDEVKEEIIKILMSVGLTHKDLVKIALFVLLGGIEDGK